MTMQNKDAWALEMAFGMYHLLAIIEHYTYAIFEPGFKGGVKVTFELARFQSFELRALRRSLELIVIAADYVQEEVADLIGGGRHPLRRRRWYYDKEDTEKKVLRIIEAAEDSKPRVSGDERAAIVEARWFLRELLSLVETTLQTVTMDDEVAYGLLSSRLSQHDSYSLKMLHEAADLVILAAAVVLAELDELIAPHGTVPLPPRKVRERRLRRNKKPRQPPVDDDDAS